MPEKQIRVDLTDTFASVTIHLDAGIRQMLLQREPPARKFPQRHRQIARKLVKSKRLRLVVLFRPEHPALSAATRPGPLPLNLILKRAKSRGHSSRNSEPCQTRFSTSALPCYHQSR